MTAPLPKFIRVGTHKFEVVENKRKHDVDIRDNGTYGYCIDKDNAIVLDKDMPLTMKRITLFHEMLHAVRFIYGGNHRPKKDTTYEEWEHFWIGIYEEPVVQILRENPDLVAFLLDPSDT